MTYVCKVRSIRASPESGIACPAVDRGAHADARSMPRLAPMRLAGRESRRRYTGDHRKPEPLRLALDQRTRAARGWPRAMIEGRDRGDLGGSRARHRVEQHHRIAAARHREEPAAARQRRERLMHRHDGFPLPAHNGKIPSVAVRDLPRRASEHDVEHNFGGPLGTLVAGLGMGAYYLGLTWINVLLGIVLTPFFLIPATWVQDAIAKRKSQQR